VKTPESRKKLVIAGELLAALQAWKQETQFPSPDDWVFTSPTQLGRFPWSYDQVWRRYQKAAKAAGLAGLGTHCLRHTYRTWLDSVGTPIGVMQKHGKCIWDCLFTVHTVKSEAGSSPFRWSWTSGLLRLRRRRQENAATVSEISELTVKIARLEAEIKTLKSTLPTSTRSWH